MRGTLIYAGLFSLAFGTSHLLHRHLDQATLTQPTRLEETLPSPFATRVLSLGHYALVADYYWLRSLSHFGDARMHKSLYPNLEPFLNRAITLDPYFKSIYTLAGTALTLKGMDVELSNRILEQGMRYRPDVWQIPFYLGFNYYYFNRDFARAAETLAIAAKLDGAPEYAVGFATRLSAEASRPQVGLQLVEAILEGIDEEDQELRAEYESRRNLLRLEVQLGWLNQAASAYERKTGRQAERLEDLLTDGVLRELPEEPLGGSYYIREGKVMTTNEDSRLRLTEAARKDAGFE